ncbi:hypothetical protein RAA17_16020 [Komagataeibacter rhaeticus]|nr:hypothetical protein [Komagataeibacter rhaeticus]
MLDGRIKHGRGKGGIGTTIRDQTDIMGNDMACGITSRPHANDEGRALLASHDGLPALQADADRKAGFYCQKTQYRLDRQVIFAAKGATGRTGKDADARRISVKDTRKLQSVAQAVL